MIPYRLAMFVLLFCFLSSIGLFRQSVAAQPRAVELSRDHMVSVNRQRRIVYHHDAGSNTHFLKDISPDRIETVVNYLVSPLDAPGNQIDSVWYDWSEGNQAFYPSEILPQLERGPYPGWLKAGLDIIRLAQDAARERGREVFFSYRVNGGDHDIGWRLVPLKKKHPEWTHDAYAGLGYRIPHIFWNFAFAEVRDYKVKIIRELAENYDFDGISIDFARSPNLFPVGTQWENRDHLTSFMRQVRQMLLQVEQQRGRPLLLAARVPENILGCHFDGIDVEAWTREKLVDILALGGRSSEVDIPSFRRITRGTGIKLYPCFDYIHTSDSYDEPTIEYSRAIYTNWWYQGADGACHFNNHFMEPGLGHRLGAKYRSKEGWQAQCQLNREIGDPEVLRHLDKTFFIQRRGYMDGHIVPRPEEWWTPRHQYFYTNMFESLPTNIPVNPREDRLLTITVADDVNANADQIGQITLRLALLDPAAKELPESERNEGVAGVRRHIPPPTLYTPKGIEKRIEVHLNNLLLEPAKIESGWLVFPVRPKQLALGDNLVGVHHHESRPAGSEPISIEKLELHVDYR